MGGPQLQFCGFCGKAAGADGRFMQGRLRCPSCGMTTHAGAPAAGPALLVLALLFAQDRLLLMKRGQPPYPGKWAPPGGFVEAGESLEGAAVRELEEEIGIRLRQDQLLPRGTQPVTSLNQIYVWYVVPLPTVIAPQPRPPEAVDAQWFSEADFAHIELWDPGRSFDVAHLFDGLRHGRLMFYQEIDTGMRIISAGQEMTYMTPKR